MKKSFFKKSLAILLGIMMVLTAMGGALSVFAEDAAGGTASGDAAAPADDGYGTVEDGIRKDANGRSIYYDLGATVGFKNGDFSEGLRYWGPKNDRGTFKLPEGEIGYASAYAAVTDGVLSITGTASYDGLSSTNISLPYALEGDKIVVMARAFHKYQMEFQLNEIYNDGNDYRRITTKVAGAWAGQTDFEVITSAESSPLEAGSQVYLEIQQGTVDENKVSDDMRIDWIKLVKKMPGGYYIDLTTGEAIDDQGNPVEGDVNGFDTAKNTIHNAAKLDFVPDLSLSNGFQYWSSKGDRAGTAADEFTLCTDAQRGYAFGITADNLAYDGVETRRFQIPGIKAGDNVYVRFDIKVNSKILELLGDTPTNKGGSGAIKEAFGGVCGNNFAGITLFQINADGSTPSANSSKGVNTTAYDNFYSKSGWWSAEGTSALVVNSDDSYFYVQIQNSLNFTKVKTEAVTDEAGNVTTPAVTWGDYLKTIYGDEPIFWISNIHIVTDDANGNYLDLATNKGLYKNNQLEGGTESHGVWAGFIGGGQSYIENTSAQKKLANYAPYAVGFKNGDFSEGFKYWSVRLNDNHNSDSTPGAFDDTNRAIRTLLSPADLYELTADGTIKYKGYSEITTDNKYIGIVSVPFIMNNLKAGDQVILKASYKDAKGGKITLKEEGGSTASFNFSTSATDWTAGNSGVLTIANDNPTLRLVSENPAAGGVEIDNIQLLKANGDGFYTDLVTGEIVTSDGQQIGGSIQSGTSTNGNAIGNFKLDAPVDFTDGFRYWSSKNDRNGGADTQFDLVVDDEGEYAYALKANGAAYDGIETYRFKLEEGKSYKVMFDYKLPAGLTENYQTTLGGTPVSVALKGGTTNSNNSSTATQTGHTFGIWSTTYTGTFSGVEADTYYYVQIQTAKTGAEILAATPGITEPILIKNVKVVEVLSTGNYLDVATGEVLYGNGLIAGGTAEDGIIPDYHYDSKLYVGNGGATYTGNIGSTEGFNNGDFSDGLRFWAAKHDRVGYLLADGVSTIDKASDIAEIVDGKLTIKATYAGVKGDDGKVTGATQYAGVQSAPFTLKDSGIMVGDKLYFRLDALTTGGAKVQFVSKNSGSITVQPHNTTAWETHVSKPSYNEETGIWSNQIVVSSLDEVYAVIVEVGDTVGGTQIDNLEILRADRGGVDKAVTLDGKLLAGDLYGDANGDGKVDLIDLVRAKKHAIDNSTPVFTAAADIDLSGVVDANDYIEIIDYILGTKAPAEGVA